MSNSNIIKGFSKKTKEEKIKIVAEYLNDPEDAIAQFQSYNHDDPKIQKKFDEFSENTITNYFLPFGVAPNVKINDKLYMVPMVIEESSVVAAASNSAKFWLEKGGFKAEIVDAKKIGQVHFIWKGDRQKLKAQFEDLKKLCFEGTEELTKNMRNRGGGILDIELVDMTDKEPDYYQLKATFNTVDSMGANFINSCLEEFANILRSWVATNDQFEGEEKEVYVIMSILSNYTPECLVRVWVECPIEELGTFDGGMTAEDFAWRFAKAVRIAHVDPHRATTHNKGIYNGIDSVVLATGNDFRAVEACGHTYASRTGHYSSLTHVDIENGTFKFSIEVPMALGVVGGLTNLHPMVKNALEILGNPSAEELMMIAATIGLANNFGALKSLTTTGIQKGHMKMHLLNIMNSFDATHEEKENAIEYFKDKIVSHSSVRNYLDEVREKENYQA